MPDTSNDRHIHFTPNETAMETERLEREGARIQADRAMRTGIMSELRDRVDLSLRLLALSPDVIPVDLRERSHGVLREALGIEEEEKPKRGRPAKEIVS